MFENTEFKLIVICNLYSILSCISILKSSKLKSYCSLNDRAVYQILDKVCLVLTIIIKYSKFLVIKYTKGGGA